MGRGRERFINSSRLLGSQNLPLIFVSVFLGVSVVWKIIFVSGLRGSGVSESGVSGWGGGSFCELSICEEQGVDGRRVVRRFLIASPGVWQFSSCFPSVSVGVRVLSVTYIN